MLPAARRAIARFVQSFAALMLVEARPCHCPLSMVVFRNLPARSTHIRAIRPITIKLRGEKNPVLNILEKGNVKFPPDEAHQRHENQGYQPYGDEIHYIDINHFCNFPLKVEKNNQTHLIPSKESSIYAASFILSSGAGEK